MLRHLAYPALPASHVRKRKHPCSVITSSFPTEHLLKNHTPSMYHAPNPRLVETPARELQQHTPTKRHLSGTRYLIYGVLMHGYCISKATRMHDCLVKQVLKKKQYTVRGVYTLLYSALPSHSAASTSPSLSLRRQQRPNDPKPTPYQCPNISERFCKLVLRSLPQETAQYICAQ